MHKNLYGSIPLQKGEKMLELSVGLILNLLHQQTGM